MMRTIDPPALDPIERYLELHSWTLLKLCGAALLLIAGARAIATGPEALWQGIASFGLLALLVAALGLTPSHRSAPSEQGRRRAGAASAGGASEQSSTNQP